MCIRDSANGDIILGVNEKDKTLVITPQGNIGIGTTMPKGVLDIRGGDVYIDGNVIPLKNIGFDLGSSSNRWRDLYLSGNSINLGGLILSKSVTNELQIKDEQGNLKNITIDALNTTDIVTSNITTYNLTVTGDSTILNTTLYPVSYTHLTLPTKA